MKKILSLVLILLMCFSAVTSLASCDIILDLIFGPNNPDNTNGNAPPVHAHQMEQQTYEGEICNGQMSITYYKCSSCNKCYLDEQGQMEIADVSTLGQGHLYVVKFNDNEHYSECYFCNEEKADSRGAHLSNQWWDTPVEHYKKCDVCGVTFDKGEHDYTTGSCRICGRSDYKAICGGSYGYNQLAEFEHGKGMQKLYNKIDEAVKSVHDNANVNVTYREIGEDVNTHKPVSAYALQDVDASDCYLTQNEASIVVASYNYDNPLYYWISKQCGVAANQLSGNATAVTICVLDEYAEGTKRVEENTKIYSEIDKYLSAVSTETDPYNLTRSFHNAIIDNINYAYSSNNQAEEASWAHNIVGVFDNKYAVCEGYAKAFQLLLNARNVENIYIVGDSKGEGHAWNLVNLANSGDEADRWYWYDLTWDDQPHLPTGKMYDYFCKTDKVFAEDHTVSNVKEGLNYFYDLPEVATKDYDIGSLQIDESVTINGITYTLVGNNRLAVTEILIVGEDKVVTIPSAVLYKGTKYAVKQIDAEALIKYTYNDNGEVISQAGPTIVKLVIPSSVDVIYNKSIHDADSLVAVVFESSQGWRRYVDLSGQKPEYEAILAEKLSDETTACELLKENPTSGNYVWVKNPAQ